MKDFNLFILWANGRNKEAEILADIREHFEILQIYEVLWDEKLFNQNLGRFYGKKLPSAVKKRKLCGTDSFLIICINDLSPQRYNGKNLNLTSAKHRYRQMLGGNYLHASDNQTEAEENLLLLTGLSPAELPQTPHANSEKAIILRQNLIGIPSWESKEQLLSFISKIPQTQFIMPNIIKSKDNKQTARLLNARKKLLSLNRNRYLISISSKPIEFLLKETA